MTHWDPRRRFDGRNKFINDGGAAMLVQANTPNTITLTNAIENLLANDCPRIIPDSMFRFLKSTERSPRVSKGNFRPSEKATNAIGAHIPAFAILEREP